jgi:tetratricopeptide (TPR) repeat protein
MAIAGISVAAEPYLPEDESTVLEVLPDFLHGGREKFIEIQDQLQENPTDDSLAYSVADFFFKAGEIDADPRLYGIARTVIDPWWTSESVPSSILLVRAKLKIIDQRFDEAIVDLIQLNSQQPKAPQALIELADLYRLKGRYGDGRSTAKRLQEIAGDVPYLMCKLPIDLMTGRSKDAQEAIELLQPRIESEIPEVIPWLRMTHAQMAELLGNMDQADELFRQAIDEAPDKGFIKQAYADFLINVDRPEPVIDMLQDDLDNNEDLLRVAIAVKRTGDKERAEQLTQELTRRFEAVRRRGDRPNRRIAAGYYLDLMDEPDLALQEALGNWEIRKDLVDSRLVLRSALAAERPRDAVFVKKFLHKARTEDVTMQRLILQLESL